jgi:RNA polymerase sigma factor (sigma-70 family)
LRAPFRVVTSTGLPPNEKRKSGTLGSLLYANRAKSCVSEQEWVGLVRSIGMGDQSALHALYERTHRIVFTLFLRLPSHPPTAEELTLNVYQDVWRTAAKYDATAGSVLGWIMNLARARVTRWSTFERRESDPGPQPDDQDNGIDASPQARLLRKALTVLTLQERQAIEVAFFSLLTYQEVSARLNEPLAIIKARIRSGLGKLAACASEGTEASEPSASEARCDRREFVYEYILNVVPPSEAPIVEAHIFACPECQQEMKSLRPLIESFVFWPTDVLRPRPSLRTRLAWRIAKETGGAPMFPQALPWPEPEWEDVARGISCKLLATDTENHHVSMLVRLAPGIDYPPHRHGGLEELHLLQGELWINDRKLYAGNYNRAEAGTVDERVWSETGCTCVLMTSTEDVIL